MKKQFSAILFVLLICMSLCVPAFATNDSDEYEYAENSRLVDMADILNDTEEASLTTKLDEISNRNQVDIVIVTVTELEGRTLTEYADDFYDYNGYGFGEDADGLAYVVKIEPDGSYSSGNSWISTTGYAITAFTDAGIQYIGKQITPELTEYSYYEAFNEFADLCDEFIAQSDSGNPYDSDNLPKEPFNFFKSFLISVVIGIAAAIIITESLKKKMKTVYYSSEAKDYLKSGSLNVTNSQDLFLYSQVDKRKIEKESSGGSSTHESSSGTTHGGGGF